MEVDSITGTVVGDIPVLIMRGEKRYFVSELNQFEYIHLHKFLGNKDDYLPLIMKGFFDVTQEKVKALYVDDKMGIEETYTSTLVLNENEIKGVDIAPGIVTAMVSKGKIFVDDDFTIKEREFRKYFGLKKHNIKNLKFRDVNSITYNPIHEEFKDRKSYKKIKFKEEREIQTAPNTYNNFYVLEHEDKEIFMSGPPKIMFEPKPGPIIGIEELDALALSNKLVENYEIKFGNLYFKTEDEPKTNTIIEPKNGFAQIAYGDEEELCFMSNFIGILGHYSKEFYIKFSRKNNHSKNLEVA